MIDLTLEKNKKLSSTEIHSILNFSIQAADDQGFINSYVFERAIYLFAAVCIFKDRKKELSNMIADDILTAWDNLVEDGTIETLNQKYSQEMDMLAEHGSTLFEEYVAYAHSARGILSTVQTFSADIVEQASEHLKQAISNQDIQTVTSIAEKWGNKPPVK